MVNWLVIGIGDITTKRVIPAILSENRSRLCGIVTRDPAKAERYGVEAFTELAGALARCEADAVYVATPVFLHAPQTIAALRAGKHVLCEKPTALNYVEAQAMQQAAEDAGRKLGVAYYRRAYPKVNRAKHLIEAGVIGRPVFAEATCHSWVEPGDTDVNWRVDPRRAGGGPLYDIASHRIDLMNYFFGAPGRVSGHVSTLVQKMAVEDNATVMIEYDSGVRGIVDVRWHSRVARDEFRVRGTDGEIDLSQLNDPDLVYPGRSEQWPAPENLHYPYIENFVSGLLRTTPILSTGATAMVTDWVTEQVMAGTTTRQV